MSGEEWGPWIEHDGSHRPVGLYVQRVYADGHVLEGMIGQEAKITYASVAASQRYKESGKPLYRCSWVWGSPGKMVPVIRYRVRKPRGLTILEDIAANPEHEREREDA